MSPLLVFFPLKNNERDFKFIAGKKKLRAIQSVAGYATILRVLQNAELLVCLNVHAPIPVKLHNVE